MRNFETWKIASPMIFLGVVLVLLGVGAAWKVSSQQAENSEFILREVNGVLTVGELHLVMREIRYQVNIFLRINKSKTLNKVLTEQAKAEPLLNAARELARPGKEADFISQVTNGYKTFFRDFQETYNRLEVGEDEEPVKITADQKLFLTHLSDEVLTTEVLDPLEAYIKYNRQVIARTEAANRSSAQLVKIGFLLLGLCGGAAGAVLGLAIAKSIRKSIVQLKVSVNSMKDRLSDLTGPVEFTRQGDLKAIESDLKKFEDQISSVVADLQKREIEVLRSEQLAQVGKLAAGLAHELRNPLMPIKMLVQVAMQKPGSDGLKGHSLDIISDEITRMENSIDTFLNFAKPPRPEVRRNDFTSIIENVIKLVSARVSIQQVELQVSCPEHRVMAEVDRGQMNQLVLNLLLNALDAMHAPGVLQVKLAEHDDGLELVVADSGSGIPTDMLSKIFDPFVTSKPDGIGLGLSICKRIAEAHGGVLYAVNQETSGAKFTFKLPIAKTSNLPDHAVAQVAINH